MNASVTRAGFLVTLAGLAATLGGCGFMSPLWEDSIFYVWQIPVVLILVALIIFWMQYRKKQM